MANKTKTAMDQKIYNPGLIITGMCLLFLLAAPVIAYSGNGIAERTAEMTGVISGLERSDADYPEYTKLIEEIFSGRRNFREAGPILNEFLMAEENHAGRRYFFSELQKTANRRAIQYLQDHLSHEITGDLALQTLQAIPGSNINRLLRRSFSDAPSSIQAGIITALGNRRDESSVRFIAGHIDNDNSQLSRAAISALGTIGTERSADLLTEAMKRGNHPEQDYIASILVENAGHFFSDNQQTSAFDIYSSVIDTDPPVPIAAAAIKGMMETTTGDPAEILKQYLASSAPDLKRELTGLVRILPDSYDNGIELLRMEGITESEKIRLIMILAYRGDRSIHDELKYFLEHDDPSFREPAIHALSKIATAEDIPLLVRIASTTSGREQELAREGLYRMSGDEVDDIILDKALTDIPPHAAEFIRAIGNRNIPGGATVLLESAKSIHPAIRMESYRSLGMIGQPEIVNQIVELLIKSPDGRERRILGNILYMVAIKGDQEKVNTSGIKRYLPIHLSPDVRSELISVLGRIQNPDDLEIFLEHLDTDDMHLKNNVIRALHDWPDAGPKKELREIVEDTDDMRLRTLALRAHNQVVMNDPDLSHVEKAQSLEFGFDYAINNNEKKLIISALGRLPVIESLRILVDQMSNPDLLPETESAILDIVQDVNAGNPVNTRKELERALYFTDNEEIKKYIRD
ncbi:MAG: HEAT repeat domain-containing protein [Marinilabiliales bacterium]|nr:MAG: HEAT repeat domain-containing protein [Marinilabiliales bacterium]